MSTEVKAENLGGDGSGQKGGAVKKEEPDEASEVCQFCEQEPCLVVELNDLLNSILWNYSDTKTNKQIRYCMYTDCTSYMHGYLGKGNRKKVPKCLEDRIHFLAPDKEYTGFIPSNEQVEE